jgi:hypothetical protein
VVLRDTPATVRRASDRRVTPRASISSAETTETACGVSISGISDLPANIRREQWTKAVPPEPDRLVTDVDATLEQQILNVPQAQWKPDIHHDNQPDHLGRVSVMISDRIISSANSELHFRD